VGLEAGREHVNGMNSLDPVVEATVDEGSKVLFEHPVHLSDENSVLRLKEVMSWVRPLFDCLFYELPGDNEWIVVREFSRLGPTLDLSRRAAKESQVHSPQRHVHNLIHMDCAII